MKPRQPDIRAGISLLELLVALAVLSLFVAAAALTFSLSRDAQREEVDRLALQIARAESEAVATGRFTGLRIAPGGSGYVFLDHADGAWRETAGEGVLDGAAFDTGLVLRLEGLPPPESVRPSAFDGDPPPPAPHVWFDPTGLTDGFALIAESSTRRFRIDWLEHEGVRVSEEGL